jgi:aminocarboxymuconate-semialdehyde decarboxylase
LDWYLFIHPYWSHGQRRTGGLQLVFNPHALQMLVNVLGVSQVMIGSDYPYPLGERSVGHVVSQAAFLAADDRGAILSGNARRFLAST